MILGYPNRRIVPFWDHRRHSAGVTEALMMLNGQDNSATLAGMADSQYLQSFALRLEQSSDLGRREIFNEICTDIVFESLCRPPTELERNYFEALPPNLTSLLDLAAGLGTSSEFVFR